MVCSKIYWECQCSCGKVKEVPAYDLTHGKSTNCGHLRTPVYLKGKKFSMLKVLDYSKGTRKWKCQCDCGNIVYAGGYSLEHGLAKSCGCLKDLKEQQIYENIKGAIDTFIASNNQLPFAEDIAVACELTPTTVNKYKDKYKLNDYFNKYFGSRPERDLYNFVKSLLPNSEIILHDRRVIAPQELDIYIPEKKLAIEFNGDYWHNADKVGKDYHQQKTIACAKKGIHLIHIFEYEWNDLEKQVKIENLVKSRLITPSTILYARNTTIKPVSDDEAKEFLNKYHLQGYAPATIQIGLYSDKELVSILTLGAPRFNHNYAYEIIRHCNKYDVGVVGGIEKLYKYFVDTYKPESVITYSDIGKFTGNVYSKIGFKPITSECFTDPGYVWISSDTGVVLQRYETQKHKLLNMGLGTEDQTENEIMTSIGYIQVFNCGNLKMEWNSIKC